MIIFNIISSKLNFIFNIKIPTNVSCFYIVKNIIYPI